MIPLWVVHTLIGAAFVVPAVGALLAWPVAGGDLRRGALALGPAGAGVLATVAGGRLAGVLLDDLHGGPLAWLRRWFPDATPLDAVAASAGIYAWLAVPLALVVALWLRGEKRGWSWPLAGPTAGLLAACALGCAVALPYAYRADLPLPDLAGAMPTVLVCWALCATGRAAPAAAREAAEPAPPARIADDPVGRWRALGAVDAAGPAFELPARPGSLRDEPVPAAGEGWIVADLPAAAGRDRLLAAARGGVERGLAVLVVTADPAGWEAAWRAGEAGWPAVTAEGAAGLARALDGGRIPVAGWIEPERAGDLRLERWGGTVGLLLLEEPQAGGLHAAARAYFAIRELCRDLRAAGSDLAVLAVGAGGDAGRRWVESATNLPIRQGTPEPRPAGALAVWPVGPAWRERVGPDWLARMTAGGGTVAVLSEAELVPRLRASANLPPGPPRIEAWSWPDGVIPRFLARSGNLAALVRAGDLREPACPVPPSAPTPPMDAANAATRWYPGRVGVLDGARVERALTGGQLRRVDASRAATTPRLSLSVDVAPFDVHRAEVGAARFGTAAADVTVHEEVTGAIGDETVSYPPVRAAYAGRARMIGLPTGDRLPVYQLARLVDAVVAVQVAGVDDDIEVVPVDLALPGSWIAVVDRNPGGAGITEALDPARVALVLRWCRAILVGCPCRDGCRSCLPADALAAGDGRKDAILSLL